MQREIRLKFKWIRQRRREVLLFLEENYGVEKNVGSGSAIETDLGITGDDAFELIQKFQQEFVVDMGGFSFIDYFHGESEIDIFPSLFIWVFLKLFLLPFAILIFPFSRSGCKEMLFYTPFHDVVSTKKRFTVGDMITSSFTHKFTLQKDVAIRLI
jgi:hypothetical protein